MSSESVVLALLLDGPMQAWGASSRYGRRTTLAYPTRSGITGMICAAMGVPRSDAETLQRVSELGLQVVVIQKKASSSRWTDYHTIGGGYDDEAQSSFRPTQAKDGRPRPDAVLTFREYLSDAAFGALLSGPRVLLDRCKAAMENPQWGMWLGRKCCVPADMVCQGVHLSQVAALRHLEERTQGRVVRRICEVQRFDDGTDTLLDVPMDFSVQDPSQRNRPRRVRVEHIVDGDEQS